MDRLWILATLAVVLLLVSLYPLYPNDFWWHLKVGELIFQNRQIPSTNIFAWSIGPSTPYTYAAWLSELIFYGIYRLGGLELILFQRNLLMMGAFLLVALEGYRRSGSWRITSIVLALAYLLSGGSLTVRPQTWSWPLFMIVFTILSRYSDHQIHKKWLLLCPLLMIFWVNLHGAFILGGILIGIFFIGELVRTWLRQPGSLSMLELRWLGLTGVLTALGMVVNPLSIRIFDYVKQISTNRPIQQIITEWRPPALQEPESIIFFSSTLLLLSVLVTLRYHPRPTDLFLILAFLWLAWTGTRNIPWYGMVMMPILGGALRRFRLKNFRSVSQPKLMNLLLAVGLFVPGLLAQPWFVDRLQFSLPGQYHILVDGETGPLLSSETPVAAVEYLKDKPGRTLFNEMGYGSYLIWALPQQKVFIDPRVELFSYKQWLDYLSIGSGVMYNELLAKYGADRILLSLNRQDGLAKSLANDPGWQKEYEDDFSQIWEKVRK